jgi:hypothetical protein
MSVQSKLELIAIQQRNILLPVNNYNVGVSNNYSETHTRALSDQTTPINGKGTGVFLDTNNGGGSLDVNGVPQAAGSGRLANLAVNQYNQNNGYTHPNTSGNIGQVII